ncbi:hypothetical protein BBD42_30855 [Paenibacillus sp. BIHB 4019]|uniref:Phage tail protein n=1 Tax=Paenibacillus sp. BIHB 4019 TaxID=1870819 RepID=A0A1B2DRS5_9BACL|nr:phage tail domain-containing protein [Paenibacillus sp. BIHB 4019]ANY70407.1 hypothetical protein BBD42_30855 [Paenibacillus sp. BIHB 4019]
MIEVFIEGNGISETFSSLGLGLKRRDIPVLPDTRDYNVTLSDVDGEIDFGSEYGPRIINHECILMADDPTTDYQAKVIRLAQVFNAKRGDLYITYSDLPDRRYKMRYAGTMSIEKIIFDGNLSIPMKMHDPFPEALRDTAVNEYGQELEYGQGYEYSPYSLYISSSGQTFEVENRGSVDVRPIIRISGSLQQLALSNGEQTFTFGGVMHAADVLEVNAEKYTIKLNALNAYSQTNGVFLLLKPGVNTFTLNAVSPNVTITFLFRHKYLY